MPAIICLHGAGSSSAIFKFQTAKLRAEMPRNIEFVFVEAPITCGPGPGMLPLFASAGPFHCWFSQSEAKRKQEIEAVQERVRLSVASVEDGSMRDIKSREVVGILSFSQGAVASTVLLLQQLSGEITWLATIRFTILICSDFTSEVMDWVRSDGGHHQRVALDSLHLHGTRDTYAARSKMMLSLHFERDACEVVEFDGGHHLPQSKDECRKVAAWVSGMTDKSEEDVTVTTMGKEMETEMMPATALELWHLRSC
jgi:predicted esterase